MEPMDVDSNGDDDSLELADANFFEDFFAETQQQSDYMTVAAAGAVATAVASHAMDHDSSESQWGGSAPGKAPNKKRNFQGAYDEIVQQYFSGSSSIYDEKDFERRFRMSRSIFFEIWTELKKEDLFEQKINSVTKKRGIRPLVRFCACIRHMATGEPYDSMDEKFQISESELHKSFLPFCRLVVKHFGEKYINRQPTNEELERILTINSARGFPGMFASWDCKHFVWSACPRAWAGQHKGKESGNTLVLEAICCPDLYIWQHYFGNPGSLNDLNILDKSSIVESFLRGDFRLRLPDHLRYNINGTVRDWLYFLVDGIYPKWSIFISTLTNADPGTREAKFASFQEAVRKDIERAFGVLMKQFGILQRPIRMRDRADICTILDCCIIIHNMIVVERRSSTVAQKYYEKPEDFVAATNNLDDGEAETLSLFGEGDLDYSVDSAAALYAARVDQDLQKEEEQTRLMDDLLDHISSRGREDY